MGDICLSSYRARQFFRYPSRATKGAIVWSWKTLCHQEQFSPPTSKFSTVQTQKRIFKFDGSRDPQQSLELMERGTLVRKPDEAPTLLACRGAAEGLPGGVLVPGRAAPRQSPGPSASPVQLARAGLILKDAERPTNHSYSQFQLRRPRMHWIITQRKAVPS